MIWCKHYEHAILDSVVRAMSKVYQCKFLQKLYPNIKLLWYWIISSSIKIQLSDRKRFWWLFYYSMQCTKEWDGIWLYRSRHMTLVVFHLYPNPTCLGLKGILAVYWFVFSSYHQRVPIKRTSMLGVIIYHCTARKQEKRVTYHSIPFKGFILGLQTKIFTFFLLK